MNAITLNRSTVLASARVHRPLHALPDASVRVGGITMGNRTMVGNAQDVISRAYGPIGARVGSHMTRARVGASVGTPTQAATTTVAPASNSGGVVGTIGRTAGWLLLASMVAGPPAVGYLIGGKVGLAVGAVVAAPMVVLFSVSLLSSLREPTIAA